MRLALALRSPVSMNADIGEPSKVTILAPDAPAKINFPPNHCRESRETVSASSEAENESNPSRLVEDVAAEAM
jgi:hypothetical protein